MHVDVTEACKKLNQLVRQHVANDNDARDVLHLVAEILPLATTQEERRLACAELYAVPTPAEPEAASAPGMSVGEPAP